MTTGGFLIACFFTYSALKLSAQANKLTLENTRAKFRRFTLWFRITSCLCSVFFLVRFVLFVVSSTKSSRSKTDLLITSRCGLPEIWCNLLALWLPEITTSAFISILHSSESNSSLLKATYDELSYEESEDHSTHSEISTEFSTTSFRNPFNFLFESISVAPESKEDVQAVTQSPKRKEGEVSSATPLLDETCGHDRKDRSITKHKPTSSSTVSTGGLAGLVEDRKETIVQICLGIDVRHLDVHNTTKGLCVVGQSNLVEDLMLENENLETKPTCRTEVATINLDDSLDEELRRFHSIRKFQERDSLPSQSEIDASTTSSRRSQDQQASPADTSRIVLGKVGEEGGRLSLESGNNLSREHKVDKSASFGPRSISHDPSTRASETHKLTPATMERNQRRASSELGSRTRLALGAKASFNLLLRFECPYSKGKAVEKDVFTVQLGDTAVKNMLIRFGVFLIDDKLAAESKTADHYRFDEMPSPFFLRLERETQKGSGEYKHATSWQSHSSDHELSEQKLSPIYSTSSGASSEVDTKPNAKPRSRTESLDRHEKSRKRNSFRRSRPSATTNEYCIGYAETDLRTIVGSVGGNAPLPVWSHEGNVMGMIFVRIAAMKQGKAEYGRDTETLQNSGGVQIGQEEKAASIASSPGHRNPTFGSRVSRWFHFRNSRDQNLVIEEDLRESVYCFEVPRWICKVRKKERSNALTQMEAELKKFEKSSGALGKFRRKPKNVSYDVVADYVRSEKEHGRIVNCLNECMESLRQQIQVLDQSSSIGINGRGPNNITFKGSTEKASSELRFLPTNLHLQEMRVRHLGPATILPNGDVQLNDSAGIQQQSGAKMFASTCDSIQGYLQMVSETLRTSSIGIDQLAQEIMRIRQYAGDAWKDFVRNSCHPSRLSLPVIPIAVEHVVKLWVPYGLWGVVSTHNSSLSPSFRPRTSPWSATPPSFTTGTSSTGNNRRRFEWQPSFTSNGAVFKSTTMPIQEHIYDTVTVGAFAAHCLEFENGGLKLLHAELVNDYSDLLQDVQACGFSANYMPFLGALERLLRQLYNLKKEDLASIRNSPENRRKPNAAATPAIATQVGGREALDLQRRMRKALQLAINITSREDIVISQAATALVTCFSRKLRLIQRYMHPHDGRKLLRRYFKVGFLFLVQSFLSTYKRELGMLQDFAYGVSLLKKFRIQLLPPQTKREGRASPPDDGKTILSRPPDDWKVGNGGEISIVNDKDYYTIGIRLWTMAEDNRGLWEEENLRSRKIHRRSRVNKGNASGWRGDSRTTGNPSDTYSTNSSSSPSRVAQAWMAAAAEEHTSPENPNSSHTRESLQIAYANAKKHYGKQFAQLVPPELLHGHFIYVTPVIFNQGVNEEQTMSNWAYGLGSSRQQNEINSESFRELLNYFSVYKTTYQKETASIERTVERLRSGGASQANNAEPQRLVEHSQFSGLPATAEPSIASSNHLACLQMELNRRTQKMQKLDSILKQLDDVVKIKREKRIDLLSLASNFARMVHGGITISCKSAKDRTSMGITLEQAKLLEEEHGLTNFNRINIAEFMRRHGVRRLNALKNVGSDKYAFNQFQKAFLPEDLRPPTGTGGGGLQS